MWTTTKRCNHRENFDSSLNDIESISIAASPAPARKFNVFAMFPPSHETDHSERSTPTTTHCKIEEKSFFFFFPVFHSQFWQEIKIFIDMSRLLCTISLSTAASPMPFPSAMIDDSLHRITTTTSQFIPIQIVAKAVVVVWKLSFTERWAVWASTEMKRFRVASDLIKLIAAVILVSDAVWAEQEE